MGATYADNLPSCLCCFDPRTRDGCDIKEVAKVNGYIVSIHAPVMGATWSGWFVEQGLGVSIHAPVMGATVMQGFERVTYYVSIHAPVMGATLSV